MLPEYEALVQKSLVVYAKAVREANIAEVAKKQLYINDYKEKLETEMSKSLDEREAWHEKDEDYRRKRAVCTDTIYRQREENKALKARNRKLSTENRALREEYSVIPQKIMNYQIEIMDFKERVKKLKADLKKLKKK